jgi:hypothetical protein
MNDLELLRDGWGTPSPPALDAFVDARAALVARAAGRRRPRPSLRLAGLGAAVLALGTTVAVLGIPGRVGGDGLQVANAAQALERAAAASAEKPFTPPRPDQWIYIEERFKGVASDRVHVMRSWRRADGHGMAWLDEAGKLRMRPLERPEKGDRPRRPRPAFGPLAGYDAVAGLPADPEALRRWAYGVAAYSTNGPGTTDDGDVYLLLNNLLRENLVPPEREAAIFRAMKQIPGVTLTNVDVFGRAALSLGLDTADWLHEELLLDPQTYAYLGERSTVIRDATLNPEKVGNETGDVHRGDQAIAERLVTAIVDEAGARP